MEPASSSSASSNSASSNSAQGGPPTFTVGELCEAVKLAFQLNFPDELWLRGEVVDLKRPKSGHVYFTLCDPGELGRSVSASLAVTLLADRKYVVNQILKRSGGGVRMNDGVEVRIRGRLEFYPPSGRLSFLMTLIDPEYTLGRLVADRDRLLRALASEGLLRQQAALAVPLAPLRIGLVTSRGSAAEADFVQELAMSGMGFRVRTFHAQVQGSGSHGSIVRALRAAERHGCELIALVRGGGARTDLATFDSEEVARAIAATTVPVWTGIGHEIDRAVADDVAHRSFKTPTACAQALVETVSQFLTGLDARWATIAGLARTRLDAARGGLERRAALVTREARAGVGRAEERLDGRARRIEREATHVLRNAESTVALAATRAALADPARLLARGWSITRDGAGHLVRSAAAVAPGTALVTTLADGRLHSTVGPATSHALDLPESAPTDDR